MAKIGAAVEANVSDYVTTRMYDSSKNGIKGTLSLFSSLVGDRVLGHEMDDGY